MSDIYGRIITGPQVEQAAISTIKYWIDNYLTEVAYQINWTGQPIARPRSYTTRTRTEHFPDDQLPQIVVVSPGLAEAPKKHGSSYRAIWAVGAGAVVSSKDEVSTKDLAKVYAAALRALLIQHQDLGGLATGGVVWLDESYDDIPDVEETARSLASGVVYLRVEVDDVVSWPAGPRTIPTVMPAGDWPHVERVQITTDGLSGQIQEPLEEEQMIVATTGAGLGAPQENGKPGEVVVGAYPSQASSGLLRWDKASGKWLGDEFEMITTLDQWGMRLDDTTDLTVWQYFYRPVYFAGTPTGGWGTLVGPLDDVAALYAAGLHLEEKVGGLMNGNDTVAMTIAAYYYNFAPGDMPNAYAASGGLGFGNLITGPISAHNPGGGGERAMEWAPNPDSGWQTLPIATPTKPKLRASLFGKMGGAGPLTGAGKSGEISDVKVTLRWVYG